MKKALIALLACSALCAGIAYAAQPGDTDHRPFNREDMAKHHAEMCSDMYAREVGAMAFLKTKLALTSSQEGAFGRWESVKLGEAKTRSAKCASMQMPDRMAMRSPVEHLDRMEDMLKARLAAIETEKPALATFYASLNDGQKKEFAEAARHRMMERMHGGMGMMHGGMHRHGPGPMGDDGDHDGPPPPPSQGE